MHRNLRPLEERSLMPVGLAAAGQKPLEPREPPELQVVGFGFRQTPPEASLRQRVWLTATSARRATPDKPRSERAAR